LLGFDVESTAQGVQYCKNCLLVIFIDFSLPALGAASTGIPYVAKNLGRVVSRKKNGGDGRVIGKTK